MLDWLVAQMAFVQWDQVKLAQVFLPYMTDRAGQSVYQMFERNPKLLGEGAARS